MSQTAERLDASNSQSVESWAEKLDVSPDQIHEAIGAVGDLASDVEMHLKGTRSTTNEERVDKAS